MANLPERLFTRFEPLLLWLWKVIPFPDRLRRALNEPETLMLLSGYAFGDEHLNELIFDAARRRPRSEFIAFCYSTIPETLAATAAVTPNLQVVSPTEAILGGLRAGWTGEFYHW